MFSRDFPGHVPLQKKHVHRVDFSAHHLLRAFKIGDIVQTLTVASSDMIIPQKLE